MRRIVPALAAFLALAPLPIFGAQEPGPTAPADLGDLLRLAEESSPALRAMQARLESARSTPSQVQAPPDPEVSVSYLNDGVSRFTYGESEFSYLSLTWTQELPFPGKLRASGEAASFDVERAAKDLELARLRIKTAVKSNYAELYRLDRTHSILEETRAVLESLEEAARRRYEAGEGIQESVLKAQTEILRLDAELARITQDRRAAASRLNAEIGRSPDAPIGPADVLPEGSLAEDPAALPDAAVAASPEVAGLEAIVKREESGVKLSRLGLQPDFVWSASYQNRDGLDPMVMGSFGVRLPLHRGRKQAQALSQKQSDLTAARAALLDAQVRTRATVREILSRLERANRLRDLYGQGVIPQASSTLESARASYATGRIGLLDVLNDLTALQGARVDLATQEAERLQALAALEPLLARDLIVAPGGAGGEGGRHAADR